jgi:hypothetical protein
MAPAGRCTPVCPRCGRGQATARVDLPLAYGGNIAPRPAVTRRYQRNAGSSHASRPLPPRQALPRADSARIHAASTAHLGGPQFWIKRDDCTGARDRRQQEPQARILARRSAGSRARPISSRRAPCQSNHVRQTAAVAAKFGLKCTALLEHRIKTNDPDYLDSGNVLLDRMMGLDDRIPRTRRST